MHDCMASHCKQYRCTAPLSRVTIAEIASVAWHHWHDASHIAMQMNSDEVESHSALYKHHIRYITNIWFAASGTTGVYSFLWIELAD